MNRRWVAAACIVVLIALAIAVHATALSGWWLNDDSAILVESIRQPAASVLFDAAEYSHLSTSSFTPLVLLSFKLDLPLHGLDPRVFYAHQLAALVVAALLLFLVLRRYVPVLYAAAGAGVFITSWVSVYAVRTLMIRHYIEGLAFALGALLAWSYGRRGLIAGSVLYLLAMLSKEVYAPIPLFFIVQEQLESRRWREIARDLIAPSIAAIVFLAWRYAMTGLTGSAEASALLSGFPSLPHALWSGIVGPAPLWPQVVWVGCVVAAFAAFLARHRLRGAGFLAAAGIVVMLPILPLIARFETRYSFAFVAFGIGVVTIAAGLCGRRWAIAIPLSLLATTTITAVAQRRYYEHLTTEMAGEGRYVWTQRADAPALAATSPEWYLGSLVWLRGYEHRGSGPRFVFSRYAITTGAVDPNRTEAIASDGSAMPVASTDEFGTPAEWQRERQRYDPVAPLFVDFDLRNHNAEWRLGPAGGRFTFLTDPGYSAIPIPATGRQRVPAAREQQYFRILRQADDGRWTISPRLPVPPEGSETHWRRDKN